MKSCPSSKQSAFADAKFVSAGSLWISCCLIVAAAILFIYQCVNHRKSLLSRRYWGMHRASGDGAAHPLLGEFILERAQNRVHVVRQCLIAQVPSPMQASLMSLIVANGLLFLSSNTSIAASVKMSISYASDEQSRNNADGPSLFDFSLRSTIGEMWKAGVYPLAVLIGIFSGVWPYLKLTLLAICLLTSPRMLNLQRRGSILNFMESFGKWSLIDAFVIVLFIIAFRFRVETSSENEHGSLNMYVQPYFGCYRYGCNRFGPHENLFISAFFHHGSPPSQLRCGSDSVVGGEPHCGVHA